MKFFRYKAIEKLDAADFYCGIHFYFEGSKKMYNLLLNHFEHFGKMYNLEMMRFHKWESDGSEIDSYIRVHFRKTKKSQNLPPNLLKTVFQTDAKILVQIFAIEEIQFFETPEDLAQD